MKFKFTALLVVLPAVIAGLLVSAPAEAATNNAVVKTRTIAIYPSGGYGAGKVLVTCGSTKACKGTLSFPDDTGTPYVRSYSIKGRSSGYVTVLMHQSAPMYPQNFGTPAGDYKFVPNVRLTINESAPYNSTARTYTTMRTESQVSSQEIKGNVHFEGTPKPTNVRVELLSINKGGSTTSRYLSPVLNDGDPFSKSVQLGLNNASSSAYRLRIIGTDQDGNRRSWFWRGYDGNADYLGGKYIVQGSSITANKNGPFVADFYTGTIDGTIGGSDGSADVTVAAPPAAYSSSGVINRDLDIPGCANIYGETSVGNGPFTVNMLPATVTAAGSKKFMVRVDDHASGKHPRWNGTFGSCFDVLEYGASRTPSTANLITSKDGDAGSSVLGLNNNTLTVNANLASSPTSIGDRYVRLREKVPNAALADSPVIANGFVNSSGNATFAHIPAGQYWVEVGRRTGCSDWYRSRYTNNNLYFKGEDRSSERWKAFRKLRDLSGGSTSGLERIARTASPYPATNTQNSGSGWMYRAYCGATGAGRYVGVTVAETGPATANLTVHKGATVTGRVTRGGGRTNKEMLVSLVPTSHNDVLRTDLTDGSGRFSVKGLDDGTYRIVVNADSWRGITRTFSGRHSITVKAGRTYGAGTLRFQNQSDKADSD